MPKPIQCCLDPYHYVSIHLPSSQDLRIFEVAGFEFRRMLLKLVLTSEELRCSWLGRILESAIAGGKSTVGVDLSGAQLAKLIC